MVTSSFPSSIHGTHGTFVFQMARHVARLPGYEVTVLAPYTSSAPMDYELDGVTVRRFHYCYPRRSQLLCEGAGIPANIGSALAKLQLLTYSLTSIVKTLRQNEVDLIHAHWPIPNALGAVIRKRLWSVPYVTTVYGAEVYLAKRYGLTTLLRLLLGCSHRSITISRATYEACLTCGVPEEKLHIIPLGVDTNAFRPLELGRQDGGTCKIISVGRLVERKGFDYLLEAVSTLVKRGHSLRLVIVGSGPREGILRQRIKELRAQKYIELLGSKSPTDLVALYGKADLFVLPAIVDSKGDTEGLGVVYLEAMACGLPVIGTNVGGVPDLIQHGFNGLLVPQKDSEALAQAILDLMTDRSRRDRLARNAYGRVRDKYDWQGIAERYALVYQSIG